MKKILLLLICFSFFSKLDAQIVINELNIAGNWVELYNASPTDIIDITNYAFCNRPRYQRVSRTTDTGMGVSMLEYS